MIRGSSDRAESTQLSHLFGIAMTAVLITIILTGTADYVQNERADVAETQLETIGNRLAAEVERVDELGRQGGQASARMQVQSTVAGEDYAVRIGTGDACVTGNFDSDRCLVLETVDGAARTKVPLNVSTGFTISEAGTGTLLLTVDGDGSRSGTAAVVDRQLRIGVGEDFQGNRYGEVVDPTNRPPIAKIDFSPSVPRSSDPVQFSAVESFDPDGRIELYKWDLDNDGGFEVVGEGPNVTRDLPPGPHRVTLQVVDNAPSGGAKSNATVDLRVSGLAYNGDLDDSDQGQPGAISFSVTNEWTDSINITEVMIRPKYSDPTNYPVEVDNDCGSAADCPYSDGSNSGEVLVDRDLDGGDVEGVGEIDRDPDADGDGEIPPDGVIVELENTVELFDNIDGATTDSARIWVGSFLDSSELAGTAFEIGVRYEINGNRNSTVFTDVVGSPTIEEFRIETGRGLGGDQVDAVVVSDERLDEMEFELGAGLSGRGTVDSTGTATKLPNGNWEHRVFLGDLEDGVVKANLTVARNESVSAFETRGPKSINRSVAVLSGEYTWTNGSDWNAALDQEGVVHDSYGVRRSDEVRIGYADTGAGLAGYWPFDGSADDIAGGRDGTPNGVDTTFGVFGTPSYSFSGGYVEVPGLSTIHSGTSSLAVWVKTSSDNGDSTYWSAPGITGVEDVGGSNDIFWGWLDDAENIGIQAGDDDGARSSTPIDDGQWHHVVLTYDSSTGMSQVFVDGVEVSSEATAQGGTSMSFSRFGEIRNTGERFSGRLDEIRSYDRVLNDDEVRALADKQGSMTTDWKNGTDSLDLSDLVLQYGADVPLATDINVTVEVVTDNGTRLRSDKIELRDGQDSITVDGLGSGTARSYRLDVELATDSPVKTPILYQIGVREDS